MEKWENYTEEELKEKLEPLAKSLKVLAVEIGKAIKPLQDAIIKIAPIITDTYVKLNLAEYKSNNWRKMHGLPLYRYKQIERVIKWN